jgi:hypothetical protein
MTLRICSAQCGYSLSSGSSFSPLTGESRKALDDALEDGVIARAEHDKKLSALVQQHRREQDERP